MAKNTFATFGILAVLLLSIGMVSAIENFDLTIDGVGSSTSSRLTGGNDSTHNFNVTINNTLEKVYVNWSIASTTTMALPAGNNYTAAEHTIEGFILTMPDSGNYKQITAHIYNLTDDSKIGEETVNVYFNNTDYVASTDIPGCMNSTANNYDSTATVDDGSCTYDPVDTTDSWCSEFDGEKGTIEIKNFYIDYIGSGDDEEWEALDEIIIEVDVKNTDSDDRIDDIIVEIRILDSSGADVTDDFDFDDEEATLGRISKKTTETATFTISELPTDVEEDTYTIYVRAYDENDEAEVCASTSDDFKNGDDDNELYHEFDVIRDDEAVIVKDLFETSILASCGDKNVAVSFQVYNIGDDEEDKVLVQLYNRELNIDEFYVIDSLRSGKGKEANFLISLPEDLSKTRYELDIYTFFAYDEDEDELERASYDENSNDIDRDASITLEILSCRGPEPSVNANLESPAEVGTDLIVKALVTNNGEDNDFVISVSDFESWADLVSVTPQTVSIDGGEFTEVTVILSPKMAGSQSFKINTIVDGESNSQSVSVNIAEKQGLFGEMSDVATYTIIGIIAVIVLILLVLIAKVSRRPAKPQF